MAGSRSCRQFRHPIDPLNVELLRGIKTGRPAWRTCAIKRHLIASPQMRAPFSGQPPSLRFETVGEVNSKSQRIGRRLKNRVLRERKAKIFRIFSPGDRRQRRRRSWWWVNRVRHQRRIGRRRPNLRVSGLRHVYRRIEPHRRIRLALTAL